MNGASSLDHLHCLFSCHAHCCYCSTGYCCCLVLTLLFVCSAGHSQDRLIADVTLLLNKQFCTFLSFITLSVSSPTKVCVLNNHTIPHYFIALGVGWVLCVHRLSNGLQQLSDETIVVTSVDHRLQEEPQTAVWERKRVKGCRESHTENGIEV